MTTAVLGASVMRYVDVTVSPSLLVIVVVCRAVLLLSVYVETAPVVVTQDWLGRRTTAEFMVLVAPRTMDVTAWETVLPTESVVPCWTISIVSGKVVTCWTVVVDGTLVSPGLTRALVVNKLVTAFLTVVSFPSMVVWILIVEVTVPRDKYAAVAVENITAQSKQIDVDVGDTLAVVIALSRVWCPPLPAED